MKCDLVLSDEQIVELRKHFDTINSAKQSVIKCISQYYPSWLTEIEENAKTDRKSVV